MAFLLIIYTSLFFYPDFYRSFHHPLHPTDIDYLFSSTIKPPQSKYHYKAVIIQLLKYSAPADYTAAFNPRADILTAPLPQMIICSRASEVATVTRYFCGFAPSSCVVRSIYWSAVSASFV